MFFDKFKLNNKIALITGGAKGIGLSIAHALGEAGAKLVVIDREKSKGGIEELSKANYDITFLKEICLIVQFLKRLLTSH